MWGSLELEFNKTIARKSINLKRPVLIKKMFIAKIIDIVLDTGIFNTSVQIALILERLFLC